MSDREPLERDDHEIGDQVNAAFANLNHEDWTDDVPVVCDHEWTSLVFIQDGEGLACRECGATWELDEEPTSQAVQVVWNSARLALEDLTERIGALEDLVETRMRAAPCEVCRRFVDTTDPDEGLSMVPGRWCCTSHVPLVLGLRQRNDEALQQVYAWAMGLDLVDTKNLLHRAQWETLVSVAPRLGEVAGERDDWAIHHKVTIHPDMVDLLKLDEEAALLEIAQAVAKLVDITPPTTRTGVGFLAGLVAACEEVLIGSHQEDPSLDDLPGRERLWTEIHNRATLPSTQARTRLIVDLFSDIVPDGNPDGLGGDILSMLTHRIAEEILSPLLPEED